MAAVEPKRYVVFIFGWDIVPLKQLASSLSCLPTQMPKKFMHVGVGVYNRIYHFNIDGWVCSPNMPEKPKILSKDGDVNYFLTTKTQADLERWLNENEQRERFGKNKYDLGNNNCITFAHQICDFLEVKFEGAHAKLESWLKETQLISNVYDQIKDNKLIKCFTASSVSFSRSTTPSTVEVYDSIIKIAVQKKMEKEYKISGSGARYDVDDGSVKNC